MDELPTTNPPGLTSEKMKDLQDLMRFVSEESTMWYEAAFENVQRKKSEGLH